MDIVVSSELYSNTILILKICPKSISQFNEPGLEHTNIERDKNYCFIIQMVWQVEQIERTIIIIPLSAFMLIYILFS